MATIKSLKELRAAGGIVSREPILRHIEWKSFDLATETDIEYDADIFILKQGAGAVMEIYQSENTEQISKFISKAVMLLNDRGKPELISYEDAYQLDPPLRTAMWDECQKVAGLVRKNSTPATNSSASSSPTELADQPSKSPESN